MEGPQFPQVSAFGEGRWLTPGSVKSFSQRVPRYSRGGPVQNLCVQPVPWERAPGVPVAVKAERDTVAHEVHLLTGPQADTSSHADKQAQEGGKDTEATWGSGGHGRDEGSTQPPALP